MLSYAAMLSRTLLSLASIIPYSLIPPTTSPNIPPPPPPPPQVQPIVVDGDLAVCEGGGGALGHPVEYITLKGSGSKLAGICKYCNLRYVSSGKIMGH